MCWTGRAWRSAPWTAFTRAGGCSTSTRTSAWTAGRASRCARWRRSTTRMTCRRNGRAHRGDRFFAEPLPGHDEPLGSPGGAARLGPVGADTPFVAGLPPRQSRGAAVGGPPRCLARPAGLAGFPLFD